MRLIDAKEAEKIATKRFGKGALLELATKKLVRSIPTIDAVPVVQYNDLRDDFIDYVCSGVPNPAPYCGNATEKCVDARGWCVNSECNGFTPRGERKE